jgi:hypothetical protein
MLHMIDLSRIRSLKTLEEMRDTCKDFLALDPKVALAVYDDEDAGPEDYEADVEQTQYLLEKIEKRMKSLGTFLSKPSKEKKVKDKSASQQPDPEFRA